MADDEGDSDGCSKQKNSKVCDSCECSLRTGQKCCSCINSFIHTKCADALIKSKKLVERKYWKCKACTATSFPLPDSDPEEDILVLDKSQIAHLEREIILLNKIIDEMKNVNTLQKQRIEYLESLTKQDNTIATQQQMPVKYCTVLKKNLEETNVLIVKPKDKNQTSKAICTELKTKIDPTTLTINRVVQKTNGSVMIKCDQQDNLKSLETNLKTTLGSNYDVIVPTKLNPKIIIFNVSMDDVAEKEKLPEIILNQNKIDHSQSSVFKIVRLLQKKKNGAYNNGV